MGLVLEPNSHETAHCTVVVVVVGIQSYCVCVCVCVCVQSHCRGSCMKRYQEATIFFLRVTPPVGVGGTWIAAVRPRRDGVPPEPRSLPRTCVHVMTRARLRLHAPGPSTEFVASCLERLYESREPRPGCCVESREAASRRREAAVCGDDPASKRAERLQRPRLKDCSV